MKLRGIYDHGRVEVLGDDLPQVRAEIEIELETAPADPPRPRELRFDAFRISTKGWRFDRDEANARR